MNLLVKTLVLGVICLFIGVGVNPAIATVELDEETIDVEPKDYLFETIVAIANNPDVKEIFEGYEHNIFNFDYNGKYIFRQLLFKNPKLLCSMVFTKPKTTTQYLDKAYKQGIELVNIFGEEKALKILDSVGLTNPELLDELNNIIMNDEDLSNRISTLIELNGDNSTICNILFILLQITWIRWSIIFDLWIFFEDTELEEFFYSRLMLLTIQKDILFYLYDEYFDCFNQPVVYKNPYEIKQIISI
jgi:hypothetical protein